MVFERRSFLSTMVLAFAGIETLLAKQALLAQDLDPGPPPGPESRRRPADDDPDGLRPNPKAQLKENEKNAKREAAQLLQLAQELKAEVDKTDQTDVLSLPLIKKAEEIEKLARQIRTLARAA